MKNKFGNIETIVDGIKFSSKLEAAVYQMLELRRKSGEFSTLQIQDHLYLTRARIGYIADFKCSGASILPFWVEPKGRENDRWPIKKKLFKYYGPGVLEIWKGTYNKPYLDEVIKPSQTHEVCPHCKNTINPTVGTQTPCSVTGGGI